MTRDGLRLFYIPPEAVQGEQVVLGAEESAHIHRVLKMGTGAICRAATEDGREYRVELTEISAGECVGRIIERLPGRPLSPLSTALGIPLLKGERFEWVLQKGCELGADAFHPLALERCEVRIQERRRAERHKRWRRIVLEAAKQCDRVPPPTAHPLGGLDDFLADTEDYDLKIVGYLGDDALSVKEALSRVSSVSADAPLRVAILTGPEGDLTDEEAGRAMEGGFLPVSLGPRILRADTAPVSLLTIVQHALGDMG
ncbi:MAG: RsmE family RNA methyltransferase [Nitrospinae bacterium]|nr:RsmE family RNA methyltransferase [Nitrospinota bacterium]